MGSRDKYRRNFNGIRKVCVFSNKQCNGKKGYSKVCAYLVKLDEIARRNIVSMCVFSKE